MASIESLKEQARRHEQKEEWQKALTLYDQAIEKLEQEEQPDIGLYNRVGDLQTRLGNVESAVQAYESAVDLYLDSELPNNAIAVCKKIIRNMPLRNSVYLKMGQIRAQQGFLVDARQNFLTYAERVQAAGDIDEALRALVEFVDLSPEDTEIRLAVAGQMEQHGRKDDAVQLLVDGYRALRASGKDGDAGGLGARIHEMDPTVDLEAEAAMAGAGGGGFETTSLTDSFDEAGGFGEIEVGGAKEEAEEEAEAEGVGDFAGFDIAIGDEQEQEEAPEVGAEPSVAGAGDGGTDLSEMSAYELGGFSLEDEPAGEEGEEEAEPLPMMEFGDEEDEGEGEPLPMMEFGEEEAEEEAEPLPMMEFGDEEAAEEPEEGLDAAAFGESDRGEREEREYVSSGDEMGVVDVDFDSDDLGGAGAEVEEAAEDARFDAKIEEAEAVPAARGGAAELLEEGRRLVREGRTDDAVARLYDAQALYDRDHDVAGSTEATRALVEAQPDEVTHRQRLVELAFRSNDSGQLVEAYLGLAGCLQRAGQPTRAQAVYQQVLSVDPGNAAARAGIEGGDARAAPVREVASSEDYVDLGSLILDDDETEKSTRFVVAYEEPSGDEQADFTKMLSQFKQKVAENLSADDVKAHHDLGTAYKEMGLLDEAIEEFQQALRASAGHLPTYELLGQCFIEQGRQEAAVKALSRALESPFEVEDELLGIYYYLGRAYESLGNTDSAVEFYDRVFSLDINFADVTERLRALR